MDLARIVQEIQYVLAPAIMISSAALLLLGSQNKFSNLAARFRTLNLEKRELSKKSRTSETERERLDNLREQVHHLVDRATHVKNAILLTYSAIASFVATSVCLFLNVYTNFQLYPVIIGFFLLGLILVLISSLLMIAEVELSYKVIRLEKRSR